MDKRVLLEFLRTHRLGVQSSVTSTAGAQSAVVGFVVTDDLQLFFDTVDTSRKVANIRQNPRVAFVIGGLIDGDERTVQYEGIADEPAGEELVALKEFYFRTFPDCQEHQSWPGICYVRLKPTWIRYSDYSRNPPVIVEFTPAELE